MAPRPIEPARRRHGVEHVSATARGSLPAATGSWRGCAAPTRRADPTACSTQCTIPRIPRPAAISLIDCSFIPRGQGGEKPRCDCAANARCLSGGPAGRRAILAGDWGRRRKPRSRCHRRSTNRNVYHCSVDKDEKAVEENRQVMQRYGLAGRGFVVTGDATRKNDLEAALDAARRRFAVPFDGVGIAVCHGITEYLDLGVSGTTLWRGCSRPFTRVRGPKEAW